MTTKGRERGQAVAPTKDAPYPPRNRRRVEMELVPTQKLASVTVSSSAWIGYSIYPLKLLVRLWKFSRMLFVVILLVPLIGGSILEYVQLQQTQDMLYRVDLRSGTTSWQQAITAPVHVAAVDAQGSLITVSAGQNRQQMEAFDRSGVLQWKTFASAETFFVPAASTQAGAVLVALGERVTMPGSSTVDKTAVYFHHLSFYLLERKTGRSIWQNTLIGGEQQVEDATILGADTGFIYVAMIRTETTSGRFQATAQLLAIERATGKIAWHLLAAARQTYGQYDGGKLLVEAQHLVWQVAGALYEIALPAGRVQWHKDLPEGYFSALLQEEFQMVETGGLLIVARSDAYHALDIQSGDERWILANPGENAVAIGQTLAGIRTAGSTLLIYGGGQVEAINVLNREVLWSQKQLDAIQGLEVSADGTLVYVTMTDSIEGSSPAQALVALDIKNGAARWTFQPSSTTNFFPLQSESMIYRSAVLLTMTCAAISQQGCSSPYLYALNAATGNVIWKDEGISMADVHMSDDGSTVLYQSVSSAWLQLTQSLRN
ncbi:MAG: hypothetical protein NVS4B7_08490 [Ktedonobacteraceae bacterium]